MIDHFHKGMTEYTLSVHKEIGLVEHAHDCHRISNTHKLEQWPEVGFILRPTFLHVILIDAWIMFFNAWLESLNLFDTLNIFLCPL